MPREIPSVLPEPGNTAGPLHARGTCSCTAKLQKRSCSAKAVKRRRGSPLGLFVYAIFITLQQHGPGYRALAVPLRRCLYKDGRSRKAGWKAAGLSEVRWPRTARAPLQTCGSGALQLAMRRSRLLLLPCRCRWRRGHGDTRTGSSTWPPRALAVGICTTRCCSAGARSQINSPIKDRRLAAPRRMPRWPAGSASARSPHGSGEPRPCSLPTPKQRQQPGSPAAPERPATSQNAVPVPVPMLAVPSRAGTAPRCPGAPAGAERGLRTPAAPTPSRGCRAAQAFNARTQRAAAILPQSCRRLRVCGSNQTRLF